MLLAQGGSPSFINYWDYIINSSLFSIGWRCINSFAYSLALEILIIYPKYLNLPGRGSYITPSSKSF